ncbi:MAG TPA: helix-turn-helix domain-containing protein [Chloroflexota bacterium]|nr:helix-turn-helix domain-containing protein [Chloroflexota bacterium]
MRVYGAASLASELDPEQPLPLGGQIRTRRAAVGLTQAEAAERLGTTESTVVNWEKGHTNPELRFWPAIIACPVLVLWSSTGLSGTCFDPVSD